MKKAKKFLALGCAAALIVSSVSGCASKETVRKDTKTAAASKEVTLIQGTLDELEGVSGLVTHSDTAGKEETVYAILSADGEQQETIVSAWLKNPEGSTELNDVSELSDITVVKGNAEYKKEGTNDQIIWSTDGSDIYYQGTSEKELPVDVKISYELDGKNVTAKELAGASGHLKITFHYINHVSKEILLHGKKCTIYQPFVMISGMVFDNEKAQNITVDNGTIVNSGDNTAAVGMAVPGLKESLGLDDLKDSDGKKLDLDIPENVTVEADVTDFSMMMTLTLASNTALSQLGLDDIDSIDDLKADMDELTDGMQEIIDGTEDLKDGADELKDGTQELSDGTQELADGTQELTDGTKELSDGAALAQAGAEELKKGMDNLKSSTPDLVSGVQGISDGVGLLSSSMKKITANNTNLNDTAEEVSDGISDLYSALETEAQTQEGLVSDSYDLLQDFLVGVSEFSATLNTNDYSSGNNAELISRLESYVQNLSGSGDPEDAACAQDIQALIGLYGDLYDKAALAQGRETAFSSSYSSIYSRIEERKDTLNGMKQDAESISAAADIVKNSIALYTENVSNASGTAVLLQDSLTVLGSKLPDLVEGIDGLSGGADKLASKMGELSKGASAAAEGADKVNSGTKELKEGASELLDGVKELADGTVDLKDGVFKFNDEGIQKLADAVNNDLESSYDRLKAVQDFAQEYTSYSGCQDSVDCAVRFIYKTDAIEK